MDDAVFHDSPEKLNALTERKNIDFFRAKPLRHVKITWKGSQEAGAQDKEYITSTDANGNFEIPADFTPGKQYQFTIEFTYRKGNTDFFSVSEAGLYDVATYPHTFEYTGEKDLRQDVNFITELKTMNDEAYEAGLSSTLTLYDETANALEFYQDHLGENLDCNLPLSVYPFWNDRRSKFEIDSGRGNGKPSPAIVITPADSSFAIPFQSQYVVYHEFSHYAMYCIYDKKFPVSAADNGPVKTINHGGYMNPSTSDSFTEGFAEFMPAIIQEYYGSPLAGGPAAWDRSMTRSRHGSPRERQRSMPSQPPSGTSTIRTVIMTPGARARKIFAGISLTIPQRSHSRQIASRLPSQSTGINSPARSASCSPARTSSMKTIR